MPVGIRPVDETEQRVPNAPAAASQDCRTLYGLGMRHLNAGRAAEAAEMFRRTAEIDGGTPTVLCALALAQTVARRFAEAARTYERLLALTPDDASARNNLGHVLIALDRPADALPHLRRAAERMPEATEILANLSLAQMALGRDAEALATTRRILARAPYLAEAHNTLGLCLVRLGRTAEAEDAFRAALAQPEAFAPALVNLADCVERLGRREEALALYDRALARTPATASLHCRRGTLLNDLGRAEEALESFRAALALEPDNALAHAGIGSAEKYLGRFDEAYAAFTRAVARAPDTPGILLSLALVKRFVPGDERLAALERLAQTGASLSAPETAHLFFALAKAYDELGRYPEAFACMAKANAAKRTLIAYDERASLALLRKITDTFSADFLAAHAGAGVPSELPVFVTGMPRSGTTLVERIIAAHPKAHGAGELDTLSDIVCNTGDGEAPLDPSHLTDAFLTRIGADYLSRVRPLAPRADRIVDKMVGNFRLAGFIRLALPMARIIHVKRDARDTCLSCYSILFKGRLDFTYDLAELGHCYRAYEEMMAHWRAVLPPESFLEVRYEDLVTDFDAEARRLIAFCGLDWNESCARFHAAPGTVRTASAVQVRRPVYRNAVGRWRHYAEELKPLLAALNQDPR